MFFLPFLNPKNLLITSLLTLTTLSVFAQQTTPVQPTTPAASASLSPIAQAANTIISQHASDIANLKSIGSTIANRLKSLGLNRNNLQADFKDHIEKLDAFIMQNANPNAPVNLQKLLLQELRAHRLARMASDRGQGLFLETDKFEADEQAILSQLEDLVWTHLQNFGVMAGRFHLADQPFGDPMTLLAEGHTSGTLANAELDTDALEAFFEDPSGISQLEINLTAPFEMKKVGVFSSSKISGMTETFVLKYRPSIGADLDATDAEKSLRLIDSQGNPVEIMYIRTTTSMMLIVSGTNINENYQFSPTNAQANAETLAKVKADFKGWNLKVQVLKDGVAATPISNVASPAPSQGKNGAPRSQSTANAVFEIRKLALRKLAQQNDISSNGITGGGQWATTCENFIRPTGDYGPWGESISNSMRGAEADKFDVLMGKATDAKGKPYTPKDIISSPDIPSGLQSKFNTYTPEQKIRFWVWFAAAVAQAESGCQPGIKARGMHGKTAAGLWQLELNHTADYADHACGSFNALIPQMNAECGLKMLNNYTGEGSGDNINTEHLVMWHGNYWQTMHLPQPGARKVLGLVKGLVIEK